MFARNTLLIPLAVLVAIASAQDAKFICPSEDISSTRCLGPKDCLYPDSSNCEGYIQCAPADDTYTTAIVYQMPCPAGLLWNDVQKWCDWPENTTCGHVEANNTEVDAAQEKNQADDGHYP